MIPSLDGVCLKLQRAYQQIELLKGEIDAFLHERPYEPTLQLDRVPGETNPRYIHIFTIRITERRRCPPEWGVILGEIVHDIRSALDHLIWQLVIYATDKPPAENDKTQFPIFLTAARFQSNRSSMLKGVSKKAASLIESFQPFATGENTSSPLWHLNQLSNIDKHRVIHLAGGSVHTYNFSFPPLANPARVERQELRECGAFEHNAVLMKGRIYSDLPPFDSDQVKMNAEMSFEVVFDQRTPLVAGWSVIRTLIVAADRTRDCVAKIATDILSMELSV